MPNSAAPIGKLMFYPIIGKQTFEPVVLGVAFGSVAVSLPQNKRATGSGQKKSLD